MYSTHLINVDQFFDNLFDMARDNFDEIEEGDYNPDIEMYQKLFDMGLVAGLALFKENEPIGYAIVVSSPKLHSKGVSDAVIDTIYIKKSERSLKAFNTLFTDLERLLKDVGQPTLSIASHVKHPIEGLLKRKGFVKRETIYRKDVL